MGTSPIDILAPFPHDVLMETSTNPPSDTPVGETPEPGQSQSTKWTRPPSAELIRPTEGRMLGGVAAGIADRLGVDRWIVRLAFVLLLIGGGAGFLLYIAGFLLIPGEGEPESIGQKWANQANSTQPWVGILLILIAAGVLFSNFPFFDGGLLFPTALLVVGILLYRGDLPGINWKPQPRPEKTTNPVNQEETSVFMTTTTESPRTEPARPVIFKPRTPPSPLGRITIGVTVIALGLLAVLDRMSLAVDADPRHYLALAVATLGLGVLVGTLYGKARWLIPFGLLLIPPMVAASVAEAGVGSWQSPQLYRPQQFAALVPFYEQPLGEMVVDLTELPWNGETVEVRAELGIGRLVLLVPAGVAIEAFGEVGIGAFNSINSSAGGFGVEDSVSIGGNGRGTVIATLEVGIGEIEIDLQDRELFEGEAPRIDPSTTTTFQGERS
jgi:phage shock protein PspC (stress-responsive transcriptional regulator)